MPKECKTQFFDINNWFQYSHAESVAKYGTETMEVSVHIILHRTFSLSGQFSTSYKFFGISFADCTIKSLLAYKFFGFSFEDCTIKSLLAIR